MSSTAENQRVNFASIKNQFPYPDFLEVQLKSFQDFLQLDTPPEKRKKDKVPYGKYVKRIMPYFLVTVAVALVIVIGAQMVGW